MARLNITSSIFNSSTSKRHVLDNANQQRDDNLTEQRTASSNGKTTTRLRSAAETLNSSISGAQIKQTDAKARSQRPLRKLEHNELLLLRKPDVASDEPKRKRKVVKLKSLEAAEDVEIGRGFREKPKVEQKAYLPSWSDLEDEQDHDGFLADLQFWTAPKPTILKTLTKPKIDTSTPRANRAHIRAIKQPTQKSTEQDREYQHDVVVLKPLEKPQELPNLPQSRPPSSYNGDPCALLEFEPPRKVSPIKFSQTSRPSTPTKSRTPTKIALKSPTKLQTIPKSPFHHAVDDFWSQDVINNWNDQYSPQKTLKSPRKEKLTNDSSGDEGGYVSPCASPRKSPVKKDRAVKDARKAFEANKDSIAREFLLKLDLEITQGRISELSKDTGGVQLIWSKKLASTAGRANWRREATVTKHSDGSVSKTYRHFANIELAEKVIDEEHRLYNTLAHEFCHLANFMISGIKDNPHGKEFKAWGKKCTIAFKDLGVEVTTKHSYEIDYKYIWQCLDCETDYKRHSKSIDITKQRCGRCKAKLVQIKPAPRVSKTSDYQIFVKEHFQKLRKEHPGEPHGFIMKLVGEMYREDKAKSSIATEKSVEDLINVLDAITLDV